MSLTEADIDLLKTLVPLERAGVGPTGLGRRYGIQDRVDGDNPRYYLMVGGAKGCVVFLFGPDYVHKAVGGTWAGNIVHNGVEWMPWLISVHRIAQRDGYAQREGCEYLDGMPCNYDSTGLGAVDLLAEIPSHDEEWLWRELEDWYRSKFEED